MLKIAKIIARMQRTKIGIIGGGQLGRMIIQAGINYPIDFYVYSDAFDFPSKNLCKSFTIGDYNDCDRLVAFGRQCHIVTIELENVNVDALKILEHDVKVYPSANTIKTIKYRNLQKQFLMDNDIPTMDFVYYEHSNQPHVTDFLWDRVSGATPLGVCKKNVGGYDGKGTQIVRNTKDLFDTDSIVEKFCKIDRELAVIISRNLDGETLIFPITEMVFNDKNMLDYLICPAEMSDDMLRQIRDLATTIADGLNLVGILAIELFESEGKIYVNEMAPRVHNSGHHTQNMLDHSQFDIFVRCLLRLSPPDDLIPVAPYGATVNLLGPLTGVGQPIYLLYEMLGALDHQVYIHIYDKKKSTPSRKLGHVNILADTKIELLEKIKIVQETAKIAIAKSDSYKVEPVVGVIMGSDSDLKIMTEAIDVLRQFNIPYETKIVSAHRDSEGMLEYGKRAISRELEIIIAGAGGAAHLPGMIASATSLPVIGVPIKSSNSIDGWDSILSILQMPNGVPVATVNLNGAKNAALLAVRMLGRKIETDMYRQDLKERVANMNENLSKNL